MDNDEISIFDKLPAEIFHKILDYLQTLEIIGSLYNVCRRINRRLISYNHYQLDLRWVKRSDFAIICNIVQIKNIVSLILSDDNETAGHIGLFLSLINIKQFPRLDSLTLIQIEEPHLIRILENVSTDNLRSLTIQLREGARFRTNPTRTLSFLSSIVSQTSIRYVDFNLWNYELKNVSWPRICTVKYLRIDTCSFNEYSLIVDQSPDLKTFIINKWSMYDIGQIFSSPSFIPPMYNHLDHLHIEYIECLRMKSLKNFLSVTLSLKHLKLIGNGSVRDDAFNGSQWKDFIQQHLRRLDRFEICFRTQRNIREMDDYIFTLLNPFLKKFWTIEKHWFFKCDFIKTFSQIRLYSIPICQPFFEYISPLNLVSFSTFIPTDDHNDITNEIRSINVNLSSETYLQPKNSIDIYSMFHQVNEVKLELDDQCPINLVQFVSSILDLRHLVKISLNIYFDNHFTSSTILLLTDLLKEAPNIHTLNNYNRTANSKTICSIVPPHLKYLQVKVGQIKDMKIILQRLCRLSAVTFHFPVGQRNFSTNIIRWMKQRQILFTFWLNSDSIHLCMDKNIYYIQNIL